MRTEILLLKKHIKFMNMLLLVNKLIKEVFEKLSQQVESYSQKYFLELKTKE